MGLRGAIGTVLVVAAFGVLCGALAELSERDYVAAILLILTGLSLLGAGTELLRPTVGE